MSISTSAGRSNLLIREAGCRWSDATIVAAVCLMYPPIASNLWFGQSEVFLCLFLALMLLTRC